MAILPEIWRHRGGFPSLHSEVDDLFNRLWFFEGGDQSPTLVKETEFAPAVNIEETENEIVVTIDLPGIDPKDVDISLENNVLTIKGERKEEQEEKKKNFHRVERFYGTFLRSLTLPDMVDSEKITAFSKDGVVAITLPKTKESLHRKIEVKQN